MTVYELRVGTRKLVTRNQSSAMLPSMTLLHAIFLGVLQGLTEFLPVSSSGHLALAEVYFKLPLPVRDLQHFDIVLHAGSLIALFIAFARDWKNLLLSPFTGNKSAQRLLLLLILASIPAALAGFALEEIFALQFRSLLSLAVQLVLSGAILILAERFTPHGSIASLKPIQTLLIGIAQACALVPGLSRSGLTIAAGRAVGLSRAESVHFSFLMAFPVIAGAVLLTGIRVVQGDVVLPAFSTTTTGFAASLVSSLMAISFLKFWAKKISMTWFAVYLFIIGAALIATYVHLERLGDPVIVEDSVRRYGAFVLFLFAFVETVPPLSFFSPGVLALIVGGALIERSFTAILFFLAAVLGAALGNSTFFFLGRTYGRSFAHKVHVSELQLRNAEAFLNRFGRSSLCLGQFTGGLRPLIAFVAGTVKIPPELFFLWMFAGTAVYIGILLAAGFFLSSYLPWILSSVGIGGALITAVALVAIGFLRRKIKKNR